MLLGDHWDLDGLVGPFCLLNFLVEFRTIDNGIFLVYLQELGGHWLYFIVVILLPKLMVPDNGA